MERVNRPARTQLPSTLNAHSSTPGLYAAGAACSRHPVPWQRLSLAHSKPFLLKKAPTWMPTLTPDHSLHSPARDAASMKGQCLWTRGWPCRHGLGLTTAALHWFSPGLGGKRFAFRWDPERLGQKVSPGAGVLFFVWQKSLSPGDSLPVTQGSEEGRGGAERTQTRNPDRGWLVPLVRSKPGQSLCPLEPGEPGGCSTPPQDVSSSKFAETGSKKELLLRYSGE